MNNTATASALINLNQSRLTSKIIIGFLVVLMFISLLSIKTFYKEDKKENEKNKHIQKHGRFLVPLITMICFFVGCYTVAKIIVNGESDLLGGVVRDKYEGIFYMIGVGIVLTIINFTILKQDNIKKYIKGKKFSTIGVVMALGVSAIVFGFLDNFGLKLGTEALDDNFLQVFLGPFSVDKRYKTPDLQKSISENLKKINVWAGGRWRSVINQVLRFKPEIEEASRNKNNNMSDLVNKLNSFLTDDGAEPLELPEEIKNKNAEEISEYIQNIKEKYDVIDDSKAMLGNTFSDFMGAILGAGIINLFVYMTAYDGVYTGDDKVDNSFFMRHLNKIAPFMEAFFIAFGCMVPVFLNIAMTRDDNNSNNFKAWIIVGIVALVTIIMMYMSVYGIKDMTIEDKKRSLTKTLEDLKERLDIEEACDSSKPDKYDADLCYKIDNFIDEINGKITSSNSNNSKNN